MEYSPTSQTTRLRSTLRNQSGAFDLTSVLVGSAVVAILVGGVATNAFGVVPWAQDNAARQELDAIRTAQGAAKVREGRFSNNTALGASGYLTSGDGVATASNEAGSCYTSVSKSSSDKVFIVTDTTTTPVEFTSTSQQSCLTSSQMMSLVGSTGGAWQQNNAAAASFVPLVSNMHPSRVLDGFNGELAMESSEATLVANRDWTDEAWIAWESDEGTLAWNSAYTEMVDNMDAFIVYQDILNRPEVIPARDAMRGVSSDFYAAPSSETQQAYVDALRYYFQLALEQPSVPLVSNSTYTPIPVTPGAEKQARIANAHLAQASSRVLLYAQYGAINGWTTYQLNDAWGRTPEGVEWDAVRWDPVRWPMDSRTDSGLPALRADMTAKANIAGSYAPGRSLQQMVTDQQAYVNALRAYYAVATVPAP